MFLDSFYMIYQCSPVESQLLIPETPLKFLTECVWQFQNITSAQSTDCTIDPVIHVTILTTQPFTSFQIHSKVNCTAEKKRGLKKSYKIGSQKKIDHIRKYSQRYQVYVCVMGGSSQSLNQEKK